MNYYIGQTAGNWFSVDRGPYESRQELKAALLEWISDRSGADAPILLNTQIAASRQGGAPRNISGAKLDAVHPLADAKDPEVQAAYQKSTAEITDYGLGLDDEELARALAEAEEDLRGM